MSITKLPTLSINEIEKLPKEQKTKLNAEILLATLQKEKENSPRDKRIIISFVFFDRDEPLFNLGEIKNGWYILLIDTIKDLSKITKSQLYGEYKKRYEPHDYITCLEKLNFRHELLIDEQREACQIKIFKGKGRIHGFFMDNIYYIVFLDNNHNMYDSVGYEKARQLQPPATEYEMLEQDYEQLKKDYDNVCTKNKKFNEILYNNCLECDKKEIGDLLTLRN